MGFHAECGQPDKWLKITQLLNFVVYQHCAQTKINEQQVLFLNSALLQQTLPRDFTCHLKWAQGIRLVSANNLGERVSGRQLNGKLALNLNLSHLSNTSNQLPSVHSTYTKPSQGFFQGGRGRGHLPPLGFGLPPPPLDMLRFLFYT